LTRLLPRRQPNAYTNERHDPEQDVQRRRDELLGGGARGRRRRVGHALERRDVERLLDAGPPATEVTFAIKLPPVTAITVWHVSGIA
jgi:hypothetical protein